MILQVALPVPLRNTFDYLPPVGVDVAQLVPGLRVSVPFGRHQAIGMLLRVVSQSDLPDLQLKAAIEILDAQPLLTAEELSLLVWGSGYYHHPIGEVIACSLPPSMFASTMALRPADDSWFSVCERGPSPDTRALRQHKLLAWMRAQQQPVSAAEVSAAHKNWRQPMAALIRKKCVQVENDLVVDGQCIGVKGVLSGDALPALTLNTAQSEAVNTVLSHHGQFRVCLLEGVTGSGKTEVYLRIVEAMLERDRQALILVPEIGLTEQTIARFRARFAGPVLVLHSGLTDRARMQAWAAARRGRAAVVIGTRSAVWTPLSRLGVIIVDEEHDLSYKQQDGFRYSARDVAIVRAQRAGVPIVLGSATPALESLVNVVKGRYVCLKLPQRAGAAQAPLVRLLDTKNVRLQGGLAEPTLRMIGERLARGEQTLLFLNRRGYAPLLLCHSCGWSVACDRCDARMVYHKSPERLCCHHCGTETVLLRQCRACGSSDLRRLGQGTERIEQVLAERFTDARIVRVDRDTTRRRGSLQETLDVIARGEADIAIGTQMLSKGHHFPNVTLVVVVDGDAGLYSLDFRASERLAQQLTQVIGRAGRGDTLGEVIVQTHCAQHPLLTGLLADGYASLARQLLRERKDTGLPPYASMSQLRAEGRDLDVVKKFLLEARHLLPSMEPGLEVIGPSPAIMERRANRFRWYLVVQTGKRAQLQSLLSRWIAAIDRLKLARRVRWSVDVDPLEVC